VIGAGLGLRDPWPADEPRFALIVIPYRAFLHNLTDADQLACLRQVRRHLRPGGRLAFNVFHPSLESMAKHVGPLSNTWRLGQTRSLDAGGCITESFAISYDTPNRLLHAQLRYDEWDPGGTLVRSTLQRMNLTYLYPADIRRLLAETGFSDVRIYGGFDEREFLNDGDELVVEARAGGE